ncbi:MAG: metallophosphoesterase [Isosphaeraceae bacterium]
MPFHLWPAADSSSESNLIPRRTFLAGLAAGTMCTAAHSVFAADEPARSPWFALLSDTHIAADTATVSRGQVMADNLRRAIDDILAQPGKPQGFLVDGDLALRDGQLDDYRTLLKLLEPVRAAKIPVHLALGNHDDRTHVREVVTSAVAKTAATTDKPPVDRFVSVVDGPGFRMLVLDSLDVVNGVPGRLGQAQLDWLAATLDASPALDALVFVHHNPANSPSALLDTEALLKVLKPRRQAKAVFFGHTHVWEVKQDEGLHLVNLPAVAYPFANTQPIGWVAMRAIAEHQVQLQLRCIGGNTQRDREEVVLKFRSA